MLFLSEGSEPAERPSPPDELPPFIVMKHFLLVRPGHDQQISFYRSRENNHGCHDLEGWMNRVEYSACLSSGLTSAIGPRELPNHRYSVACFAYHRGWVSARCPRPVVSFL